MRRIGAYPRASGGNRSVGYVSVQSSGLSPRERGKRFRCHAVAPPTKPIPARAGETSVRRRGAGFDAAYPRASGGNITRRERLAQILGLSPRERGKPYNRAKARKSSRPIPARAGETPPPAPRRSHSTAYPRASGGNIYCITIVVGSSGLSPRERGKQSRAPACAS